MAPCQVTATGARAERHGVVGVDLPPRWLPEFDGDAALPVWAGIPIQCESSGGVSVSRRSIDESGWVALVGLEAQQAAQRRDLDDAQVRIAESERELGLLGRVLVSAESVSRRAESPIGLRRLTPGAAPTVVAPNWMP